MAEASAGDSGDPAQNETMQQDDLQQRRQSETPEEQKTAGKPMVPVTLVPVRADCVALVFPRWLFWSGIILCGTVAVWCTVWLVISWTLPHFSVPPGIMENMGVDGVMMFRQYDRNDDGVLSLEEFEPLAHRLMETNETYEYNSTIDEQDEVVTVQTYFEPLQLETMTKDLNGMFSGNLHSLTGLQHWKTPNKPGQNFAAKDFFNLLPKDRSIQSKFGEVYNIIANPGGDISMAAPRSSNRYHPPRLVDESEIFIHKLLTLFHPRPFVHMRFQPRGSVGCIRAYNDDFVEVVFRIHAEFQLNEPPFSPFWFTPAQFTGHVIIQNMQKVISFEMYVPAEKNLNVDMEWINSGTDVENMEVDIGYMPLMALNITGPSVPAIYQGEDIRELVLDFISQPKPDITWTQEITLEEAQKRMETVMYPFKQVPYINFTEAYSLASKENKLVHSILLWGALDDQSC